MARMSMSTATAVSFDVTDADATATALEALSAEGIIQILVNNAGIHDDAVMPGMRRAQWSDVIDVTLNGFFNVTQPLLMPMIGTRWGRTLLSRRSWLWSAIADKSTMPPPKAGSMGPRNRSRSSSRAAA